MNFAQSETTGPGWFESVNKTILNFFLLFVGLIAIYVVVMFILRKSLPKKDRPKTKTLKLP